jgi:hypothetical protein
MKKVYATAAAILISTAPLLACSSGSEGSSDQTTSAVSNASGPCDAPLLQVIVKEKEHRFGVDNQQVALNPEIPIQNICQNGVTSSCKTLCFNAEAAAVATGVKGFSGNNVPAQLRAMGALADAFNAALGASTDFADHPIDQDPGVNASSDPNASTTATIATPTAPSADAGATSTAPPATSCNATILQVIVKEKEHRFGVNDQQVALNPEIPIQNICQNDVSKSCSAICFDAEAAAVATGIKGFSGNNVPAQLRAMGQLADTFNAALGNVTDFAAHPIDQDPDIDAGDDPNASTN